MRDVIEHHGVKGMKWGVRHDYIPKGRHRSNRLDEDDHNSVVYKYSKLKDKGLSQKEIADNLGISTTKLRQEISIHNNRRKKWIHNEVMKMKQEGLSNTEISDALGISEGTVRNHLLSKDGPNSSTKSERIISKLKDRIDEVEYLEIGKGVEHQLGISRTQLNTYIKAMEEEGYHLHKVYIKRLQDSTKDISLSVLTKDPDIQSVLNNSANIKTMESVTRDHGRTWRDLEPPKSVDPNRVEVAYKEDNGHLKDGVIELRRNVPDLDLGASRYAQVRIKVGDGHFLKGMAMYADDLPDGIDIRFNTNKSKSTPKLDAMKPLKDDPHNPFGSTIVDQRGALNIVNAEGKWGEWKTVWSSQFLSKQPTKLIKDRLDNQENLNKTEFDILNSIPNNTVRKFLMNNFADSLGTKIHSLKVKGISGTRSHVILPFTDMSPNEVYAPHYKDGDKVVLLRYPHGGIFELAELKVNNRHKGARKVIGISKDAIGIHPSVAEKLSGADFDGDSVNVIPNNKGMVKVSKSLEQLKGFDPQKYKVEGSGKPGATISEAHKNTQMGIVTNMISDMTILNATPDEISRAVAHSMVVIDSYKHNLDWRKSAKDFGIKELEKKYRRGINIPGLKYKQGPMTLVTLVDNEIHLDYETVKYTNPSTGKTVTKKVGGRKLPLIDAVDDAHKLSSGTRVESLYADYINNTRSLKNQATEIAIKTPHTPWNRDAARTYKSEVESLDKKLKIAELNKPRERIAQTLAKRRFHELYNKDMTPDEVKKLKRQLVAAARKEMGSKRNPIDITPSEWKAIESGAISSTKLNKILLEAKENQVIRYAVPDNDPKLNSARLSRARTLIDNGYTWREIADELDVSTSTLFKELND